MENNMFEKVLSFILDQKKALVKAGEMNSTEYKELTVMEETLVWSFSQKNVGDTTGEISKTDFPSVKGAL
jgi:hypothetical protein